MSMNPWSPVSPNSGFSLTPEQRQARINRLMAGDYKIPRPQPPTGNRMWEYMSAPAGQNTVTVPGVGANITNESPLATLLRLRANLDPMSQAMWDADPRNQAEITRLRREEAGLPATGAPTNETTFEDIFGPPPVVPPGTDTTAALVAWLNTLTPAKRSQWATSPRTAGQVRALNAEGYSIDGTGTLITPVAPPPAQAPSRPGTVPGATWNNPDAEAPRGYNPELWAQREIGPNRSYQSVTGMGVGGPTDQSGTAIYTPPAEVKPTRDIDPFGYEPAPAFQRQDWEGRFSGGPDVLSNAQGNTFERNLLTSIAEAAASPDPAVSGRAKFILSAASNPNVLRDMPVRKNGPANLIDRAGYQYDMENGGGPQRRQSTEAEAKPVREGRDRSNPFMSRMAGGTFAPTPGPRAAQEILRARAQRARDVNGIGGVAPTPGPRAAQEILRAEAQRARDAAGAPRQNVPSNPFMANLTGPVVNPAQRTLPVGQVPVGPNMGGARMPVMIQPSQSFPVPINRGMVPAPPPNPFLMGGATRGSRNPFRR